MRSHIHLSRSRVDGDVVVNPLVEAAQGPDHVLVVHLVDEDLQVLRLPTRLGWHARPELEVHLALGSFPSIHKFAEGQVHLRIEGAPSLEYILLNPQFSRRCKPWTVVR